MTAKIYVGTYAKYNNGSIAGAWLDLYDYTDFEDFTAAALALHADEADPELMFQDWEGVPEQFISESWLDPAYWDYQEAVDDSHLDADVFAAGMALDIPYTEVEDAYHGTANSDEDFAQELAESVGAIDETLTWPHNCIDWGRAARDLMITDFREQDGHYFSRNW